MNRETVTRARALNARGVLFLLAVTLLAMMLTPSARAETIVFSGSELVLGKQSFLYSVIVPGPGTLTITVADLGVPASILDSLSSLSFGASTSQSVLESLSGPGAIALDITSPGTYFMYFAAEAAQRFDLGLVSWQVTFDSTQAVPLPASAWLLLAGLVGLARAARGSVVRGGAGKEPNGALGAVMN